MAVICGSADACTSFADYSGGSAWYGMNFDWYPDQDILFRIEQSMDGSRVFTMSFVGDAGPVSTVGMTEDGRFSAMQVTDAPWQGPDPSEGPVFIYWPFYALIYRGASMDDIADMVLVDTYTQYDDPPLHVITADASGMAMIIEVGEDGNEVLERRSEPFVVMTNFHCNAWAGVDPGLIEGCGADRYRLALAALKAGEGTAQPSAGFDVLEAALNASADFSTRASMVFDPEGSRVYLAVFGDLDRIWSLDIGTGLLDTWPAASGSPVLVDTAGVTASELVSRH
jgi:hypothetical protein